MRSPFALLGAPVSRDAPVIHLGDEPAIEADGRRHTALDHRRVSVRWLAGTILTGLSGAGLIGAAAFAALDQRSGVAEAPSLAQGARRDDRADSGVNPRKADRLVKAVDIVAARQSFKAPTTVRVGDKDIIRSKSFTSVATPLTLVDTGLGDDIPPFDPLKLLTSARNAPEAPADLPVGGDAADVSFVTRSLAGVPVRAHPASLTAEEAQAQVGEYLKTLIAAGSRAALPLPPQLLLMRTSRAGLDGGAGLAYANVGAPGAGPATAAPFTSIEVRMVPENVTLAPRSTDRQTTQIDEKLSVIRKGETLDDVLRANAVPKADAAAVIAALGGRGKADAVAVEGRRVKMLFADLDGSGRQMTLARLSIHSEDRVEAMAAVTDDGSYVQVTRADSVRPELRKPKNDDDDEDSTGLRLYDSLYETAQKQDIPRATIDELVRIFANDVDFQRPVSAGDSFNCFYEEGEEGEGRNTLLFASITTRNETFRYYRYVTADDGLVDFYDENGRSTRKFLVRQPIGAARITSGFGSRYHPILGYTKVHTGVDFAAPIGTPIIAAGNGTIIHAGWDSGYGRRVELQHANGYITTYNHMSGFARGIAEGARVRQGQVIGFLGSTGLSTGPHLHYEVMVNGHFVDPMRVKLARTREFDGRLLGDFKRERDRIDSLMARAPNATKVAARQNGGG